MSFPDRALFSVNSGLPTIHQNSYQFDISSANPHKLASYYQSDESKWIDCILKFLKTPFSKRYSAHAKLVETLSEILKSKTTLSLIKEIINGKLGETVFALLPGDEPTKYVQMGLLISYMMTLPTEVIIDIDDLPSLDNEFQRNLLNIYLELAKLHKTEPTLYTLGSESDNSFKWIDAKDSNNNVISFYRKAPDGRHLLFFHHFGNRTIEDYEVTFPEHRVYFPIGKYVESVEEIYHTDQEAFGDLQSRNKAIRVISSFSGATTGFTFNVSPFSTVILALSINEEKLFHPSLISPSVIPCADIIQYTANLSLNSESNLEIPTKVQAQIFSAATAHLKADDTFTIHFGDDYNITDLNPEELACFYYILNLYLQNKIAGTEDRENTPQIKIFRTITFDILDYCLRIACTDKDKGQMIIDQLKKYNHPTLAKAIKTLENVLDPNFHTIFHKLVSQDTGSDPTTFKTAAIALHLPGEKKTDQPRKLKVWKVSLENSNNRIGGLASVVMASGAAHKKMNLESVHSIHPLYCHEKNPLGQARAQIKFKGIIRHEYNGEMVTSSIYKDPVTKEYLIQPDPRYKFMFDIHTSKNVYGGFHFSNRLDRYLYVASAAAAAVATYSGKNGLKSVDILQADAWHAGAPAMELLSQYLNPMRLQQHLKPIEMVYLTHMLMGVELDDKNQIVRNYSEQGEIDSFELRKIGIDTDTFGYKTNLSKRALINSRANIFVSHGVVRDAVNPNELLSKGLHTSTISGNPHKVKGITNGIDTATFDVANPKSFGKYAVKNDEFFITQKKLKNDLYKAGIIPHPTKTLAVFIGRYSEEKGIKMLPHAVEQVKKEGGQIVIMGTVPEEGKESPSAEIIRKLQALSKTEEYRNCLKVYTDIKEQISPFIFEGENCELKIGWGIRQAATLALVPSHVEACGLVPLEMQCAGALTIAPYHQGLRDMCFPIEAPELAQLGHQPYTFKNGGNAFCYSNSKSIEQLQHAIQMAFAEYNILTEEEKNNLMKKIHAYALSHYDWVLTENEVPIGGSAYEYSRTYHDIYHSSYHFNGPKERSDVETFEQALIRRNRTQAALLS